MDFALLSVQIDLPDMYKNTLHIGLLSVHSDKQLKKSYTSRSNEQRWAFCNNNEMCTVSQCPPSRSAASENRRVFAKCTKCAESTKCSIQSIVAYGAGEPHSLCKFHTGGGCLHNVHMLSLLNMKSSPNGRICEKCREIKRECVGF